MRKYITTFLFLLIGPSFSHAYSIDWAGIYECSIYDDDVHINDGTIEVSKDGLFYSSTIGLTDNQGDIDNNGWMVTKRRGKTISGKNVDSINIKRYFPIDKNRFQIISTQTNNFDHLTHTVTLVTFNEDTKTLNFSTNITSHTGTSWTRSAENCTLVKE